MTNTRNRTLASAIRQQLTVARMAAVATGMTALAAHAQQAPLPQPCTGGCVNGPASFVSSGSASYATSGTVGTITQHTDRAILNWRNFDIAQGYTVNFNQPSSTSAALNRIYSNDPSRIQGALNANGQVYLINNNGIIFGNGAQVNTGALVASALNISDDVFNSLGLAGAINAQPVALPAFDGGAGVGARIVIEEGASLVAGERVFIIAPEVENRGSIRTPDGQTILAASQDRVYVASDKQLRGLLVEVGTGGAVSNYGDIITERGNTTLVGLAVNQSGRIRATTSVNVNGSIRLVAQDSAIAAPRETSDRTPGLTLRATRTGALKFGENSVTEVLPDATSGTAVDGQEQPLSKVLALGSSIEVQRNARITATGGNVELTAGATVNTVDPAANRLYVGEGVTIDVSGDDTSVIAMERNQASIRLFGNELADAPLQRNGPLARQEITVDLRQGTPITDITRLREGVQRTVNERLSAGGSITLSAAGDVVVNPGSVLDVSGGQVRYSDGYLNTTRLIDQNGRLVDIANADPNVRYTGIYGFTPSYTNRWGSMPARQSIALAQFHQGYVEGKDAGSITIGTSVGRIALNGELRGNIATGALQREAPTAPNAGFTRSYTEVPLRGLLNISGVPNIVFGNAVPTESYAFGSPLPSQLPLTISATALRSSGINRLNAVATNSVVLPENVSLDLFDGADIALSANSVRIDGDIHSASGNVELTANALGATLGRIEIGATSSIDLRGAWINDLHAVNGSAAPTTALFIDGGSLSLDSEGDLTLFEGSVIDVSAGAQSRRNGSINYGRAGSIDLRSGVSGDNTLTELDMRGELRGFGFGRGGELSISAASFRIGNSIVAAQPGEVALSAGFFGAGGFSGYSFSTNRGSFVVEDGTQILLKPSSMQLSSNYSRYATGSDLYGFTSLAQLPSLLRGESSFAASVVRSPNVSDAVASLRIGDGARIETEIGGSIKLKSDSDLYVGGTLRAQAGEVGLSIATPSAANDLGFRANQSLYLGGSSFLDVSGTSRVQLDGTGRRTGDLLTGGIVTMTALRGYVIAAPGSTIDVSGAQQVFDLPLGANGRFVSTSMVSDAGLVRIQTAEGALLSGDMRAFAGGEGAQSGTFALTIDQNKQDFNRAPGINDVPYPYSPREIVLGQNYNIAIGAGVAVPLTFNGKAFVSADRIQAGGFDAVDLTAVATARLGETGQVLSPSTIRFDGNVSLDVARRVSMNAQALASNGGAANVRASYVSMGSDDFTYPFATTPVAGAGSLAVDANHIDVRGYLALSGFASGNPEPSINLSSRGDIRFVGIRNASDSFRSARGALTSASDMRFSAAQMYPSTLTDYSINVLGNNGRIVIDGNDRNASAPLSAAGVIRFSAADIVQGGTVRAPFGEIHLDASRSLELAAGSVTSTSGAGSVVPFGVIELGSDWVYRLGDVNRILADAPEQNIVLRAPDIQLHAGSQVDIRGGGDLLSYEFIQGPGGLRDILLGDNPDGAFAVLPSTNLFGAYDPIESTRAGIEVGSIIYLAGGNGLPAGEYARLPARYALLPGAFLIVPVKGQQFVRANSVSTLPDGVTTMSAGRTGFAGTENNSTQWSGYAVLNGAQVRQRAEYKERVASSFFTGDARNTRDAGRLTIDATQAIRLDGELQAAAASGRAAQVDIVASNLALVNQRTASTQRVELVDSELQNFGAASVLLGATRSVTANGTQLDVRANSVVIEAGTELTAEEIMLAARDNVTVASGARLNGVGAGSEERRTYNVSGNGAFARVAAGEQVRLDRTGSNGQQGTLTVAQGASLSGAAINLEASRDLISRGDLLTDGGSLSLTASQVALGTAPLSTPGLVLTNDELARFQAGELLLSSRSTIDLYGAVSADLNTVRLDAAGLRGFANDGTTAGISADALTLANSRNATSSSSGTGNGALMLTAGTIQLDAGNFNISGFNATQLGANRQVIGGNGATLNVNGDMNVAAPRITAESGADVSLAATGALTTSLPTTLPTDLAPVEALGARMTLTGQNIRHGSRIELPSGIVELRATGAGGVTLDPQSAIDVSGRNIDFREVVVGSPGGVINLTANQGAVVIGDQATLNVSGASAGGDAGSINIRATGAVQVANSANLLGTAAQGERQGSINVHAHSLASSFSSLNTQLNAGNFAEARTLNVQTGDIAIGANDVVRARNVEFSTDGGNLTVAGRILADAPEAGRVRLSARDNVTLESTGRIDARATAADEEGGFVELATRSGAIALRGTIDVSGTTAAGTAENTGHVNLRAPRIGATGVGVEQVTGTVAGAERIDIEAFRTYNASQVDSALVNSIRADTTAYMANAAAIENSLGVAGDVRFHLLPGVEIASSGNLTLNTPWDLFDWRDGGEAGVLTLRAGGNLSINQNLSDGFAWQSVGELEGFGLLPERDVAQTGSSWSYRLVAGARANAADPLAVTRGVGNLTIADATHVRTGTGSIDVVAGNDVVLSTGTSAIYTIGENRGSGVVDAVDAEVVLRGDFLHNGGDIRLTAGGSLRGVSDRPLADWLPRIAGDAPLFYQAIFRPGLTLPAIWAVDATQFQGIGALGGGDIRIDVGLDMRDTTLALPTTGQANAIDGTDTRVAGGGTLTVNVGRNITGGNIFIDNTVATIRAAGLIGRSGGADSLAPIVQISGDAQLQMQSRADIDVEAVFNPSMASQGTNQGIFDILFGTSTPSAFFRYGSHASLGLTSIAGDALVHNGSNALTNFMNANYGDRQFIADNLLIHPGTLSAVSMQGDVVFSGRTTMLYPSGDSQLTVLAARNVRSEGTSEVVQSDADLSRLPDVANPTRSLSASDTTWINLLKSRGPIPGHINDVAPSVIVAQQGSIGSSVTNGTQNEFMVSLSEQARIIAGTDIADLTLSVQHVRADSVTRLEAGRDIVYTTARNAGGTLVENTKGLSIAGPGNVDVVAGRNISFGTSKGIETTGNANNVALPNGGANINLWTGYSTRPDFDAFTDRYFAPSRQYATELHSYLASFATNPALPDVENFRALSESDQRRFISQVLFSEVKRGGLGDFTASFDAINTLFPDLDTDAYKGDLTAFLSYIRTVDGGDINIVVPNGLVNAGVAASGGFTKPADRLGVVVQGAGDINAVVRGDFAVNASRVFALDGGDIMIWSSEGNIDAGRGSKAALTILPPTTSFDTNGNVVVELPASVSGSGIRTAVFTPGRDPGDVFLFAPQGIVDAGDAGIVSAGNITIAATRVVGADNIQVGGTAVGVPVSSGGLGASLSGVSAAASSATNAATMNDAGNANTAEAAPIAETALSWLEVFVVGLGEEGCKQDDMECLKRQK